MVDHKKPYEPYGRPYGFYQIFSCRLVGHELVAAESDADTYWLLLITCPTPVWWLHVVALLISHLSAFGASCTPDVGQLQQALDELPRRRDPPPQLSPE